MVQSREVKGLTATATARHSRQMFELPPRERNLRCRQLAVETVWGFEQRRTRYKRCRMLWFVRGVAMWLALLPVEWALPFKSAWR
jgi:hypothetical protein